MYGDSPEGMEGDISFYNWMLAAVTMTNCGRGRRVLGYVGLRIVCTQAVSHPPWVPGRLARQAGTISLFAARLSARHPGMRALRDMRQVRSLNHGNRCHRKARE